MKSEYEQWEDVIEQSTSKTKSNIGSNIMGTSFISGSVITTTGKWFKGIISPSSPIVNIGSAVMIYPKT